MRFLPGAHSSWLAPIGAVGVALCGVATDDVAARATQDTTLTAVLRRAGAYVSAYKRQLGSVVADEHYVQRINEPDWSSFTARTAFGAGARLLSWKRQEMTSELLLFVQSDDDQPWIAFRDVFEVDGAMVEDRQERLVDLFRTIDLETEVTLHYELDPRLEMLVPAKMTERYKHLERRRSGQLRRSFDPTIYEAEIHCEATYSNYRRFETEVSFTVQTIE